MPTRRRLLVFDLDDTLYPERTFVLSGFRAVSDWFASHRAVPGFYESAVELFLAGHRHNIFNIALARMGIPYGDVDIARMVDIYRGHAPRISLHDDAKWALEAFGRTHVLGLLTDGYAATQRNKVAALKISNYFGTIVYSDDYGRDCWKPSPVPYLKAMEASGCSGPECIYVADNPSKDFVSARALDWRTVRIRREDGEYQGILADETHSADREVTSLRDLKCILEDEFAW